MSKAVQRELDRLGLELMREGDGREYPIYVRIDGLPVGHAFDRGEIGWEVYARTRATGIFNNEKLGPTVAFPSFDSAVQAILLRARW